MNRPLTDRQQLVLDYLRDFHRIEDRLPSSDEIRQNFAWNSRTAAMMHLKALVKKGALEYRKYDHHRKGWYRFARKPQQIAKAESPSQ